MQFLHLNLQQQQQQKQWYEMLHLYKDFSIVWIEYVFCGKCILSQFTCNFCIFRGVWPNDYILHRGGSRQMITILHRGGGVCRDPQKWLRNIWMTPNVNVKVNVKIDVKVNVNVNVNDDFMLVVQELNILRVKMTRSSNTSRNILGHSLLVTFSPSSRRPGIRGGHQ